MFDRLLFFYGEARAFFDENKEAYIDSIFDETFWNRYFSIAKNISVCFRMVDSLDSEKVNFSKMKKITDTRIKCYVLESATTSIKDYLSISRKMHNHKILTDLIKESDAAIIRLPTTVCNNVTKLCNRYKKPYLIEVVGDPFASLYYHSSKGKLLAPIAKITMSKQVKKAKNVLYVSRSFMQKLYPTNGNNVACPDANIPSIDNSSLERRLHRINEHKGPFVLGLIGSLDVNYRGHDILIQVLSDLRKAGHDCKVRFLGGGSSERWKNYARTLQVEKHVEFSGIVPAGSPVYDWIDNIDILVMPTKVESLGRAVIEAMSRGCPVIGTRTTALAELVSDDCQVLATDTTSIVHLIKNLISNSEYAEYCAYENFYRAHKYLNSMTDPIRYNFFQTFLKESEEI